MNWVPGNLHLIGKDNQNNPPPPPKRQDFLMPPTLTLTAGMQEQWWGGRLKNAVLTTRLRLYRKPVTAKQNCFCTLHCASYISHNLKWKDSMVRWHLCFSSLPSYPLTVQGPEGVRTVPEEVVTHFPTRINALPAPSAQTRQLTH